MHDHHLHTAALRRELGTLLADATARGHQVHHLAARADEPAVVLERTIALLARRHGDDLVPASTSTSPTAPSPRARPWRLAAGVAAVGALLALGIPTAGAVTVNALVNSPAGFRSAWIDPGIDEITLTADITLDCSGTPTRGAAEMVVHGNGFTITNPCAGQDTLRIGDAVLSLLDVTLDGADVGDDGIQSTSQVELTRTTIEGHEGRAVEADGEVHLDGSLIRDNFDGIYAEGRVYGIDSAFLDQELNGVWSVEGISLLRATASGNGENGFSSGGSVLVDYSTVTDNFGGVVAVGEVEAFNTTIVDNRDVGIWSDTEIELYHATITGNVHNVDGPGDLHAHFSVLADAGTVSCGPGLTTATSSYTYSDDASCELSGAGDAEGIGIESSLGPLADNGGPTLTRLPNAGGVLVDRLPLVDCVNIDDQRGVARPQGGACDLGAVERATAPSAPPAAPGNPGRPGGTVRGSGVASPQPTAPPAAPVGSDPTFTG